MLLQISNTDTLDSLSTLSRNGNNTGLFLIIGFIVVGLITYLIFRPKAKPNFQTLKKEEIKSAQIKESSRSETKEGSDQLKAELKAVLQVSKTDKQKVKNETATPVDKYKQKTIAKQKIIEIVKAEKAEQPKEKYIGYNPINIFAQTEPLNFPYVLMPKFNSVIKFPRKGRSSRKGYKEAAFKTYIEKYFRSNYQIFDDRFILVKNSPQPYEPDFTLIDEKGGVNIFLDIEIDEPYEGLSDIQPRKATHFQHSDTNRNNAFKNRGWIVIRFAEIQVHQEPDSSCRFIADVLKSINPKYSIPDQLTNYTKVKPVKQWTKEEAEKWSIEMYREKYLGIDNFGLTTEGQLLTEIEETELGDTIEEQVEDDVFIPREVKAKIPNAKLEKIYSAINSSKYVSFSLDNEKTIVKPLMSTEKELTAFCYVKNRERHFSIHEIKDLQIKDSYFTLRVAGPTIGLDQITNAINTAINYHKLIRMKYTRSSWTNMFVDQKTGELLVDRIEAEESIRTINDVQLSINALAQERIEAYNLNSNYITAYCNKREEQRTFRFDRIGEIEILDL